MSRLMGSPLKAASEMCGSAMNVFDPRLWLALIALTAAAYFAGSHTASSKYKARENAANIAAKAKIDDAIDRIRETEKFIRQNLATLADQHKKELQNEVVKRNRFIANVRSGAIRLSIPVIAGSADAASADTAAASGNQHQTRAELTPAAGITLAAIADDGDDAIRQLNSCIDAYAVAREVNVQAR